MLCLIHGIGDDCAVIAPAPGEHQVVTTDMLVEDVHFNLSWHPPYELGRKTIAVNLSDIAGMGGLPQYVFISIAIPDRIEHSWIMKWFAGVRSIIEEFDCCLAGGDTVRGASLSISVTVIGTVEKDYALLRSSARKDQSIYVSGQLGSAAAGLLLFQMNRADLLEVDISKPFVQRHLNPSPDVNLASALAASGFVTSMQDISDGIATDLAHICRASGLGAVVEESLLPHHPDLPEISDRLGYSTTDLMVSGGEDYHLLFTIEEGCETELELFMAGRGFSVYRIGKTVAGKAVNLHVSGKYRDITFRGFEH